ncbi:DoxX family membrane protein [bacterium]|nr:DoxX family membrane protein [bacterium]
MMRRVLENPYLLLVLRAGLGVMFVVASVDKIAEPDKFAIAVDNYHIVPNALVNLFALALPWIELVIGVFLVAGVMTQASALLSAILCFMFFVAVASALARGLDISCGCFVQEGAAASKVSSGLVIRDALLTLASIWVLVFHQGQFTVRSLIARDRAGG